MFATYNTVFYHPHLQTIIIILPHLTSYVN